MNSTEKLLHYFRKLSDKKQAEIVDFVEYLFEREQLGEKSPKKSGSQILEKATR